MSKTVMIYSSKYGATKRYSEWIADELNADLFESKKFQPSQFERYDTIVYGGGLYIGAINGIKLIKNNFSMLDRKKVVVFTCGTGNASDSVNTDAIILNVKKTFTPEQFDKIKLFHLRGSLDLSVMSFIDKSLMKMMISTLKKKPVSEQTTDDKIVISSCQQKHDFCNIETIKPIVEYAKNS